MLSKWVVFDQHVFCSYICSAYRFVFLIKKMFFLRILQMTVLGLKCLTISNQFCVHRPSCSFSLIFHIDIVCVCVCVFVRSFL